MIKKFTKTLILAVTVLGVNDINAQLLLPATGSAQVLDFNTFTGTGFNPNPAAGQLDSDNWSITGFSDGKLEFGGTIETGDYAKGSSTGGVTSGGIYAFEVATGNFTLGVQPTSTDFSPGSITLKIQNTSGTLMNQLTVSYDLFVNNVGTGTDTRSNIFYFSHGTDTAALAADSSLNYLSPGAADALGWVANARSIVLTGLAIADNGIYFLRWSSDDRGGAGARDEFALDNISVTGDFSSGIAANISKPSFKTYPNPTTNGILTLDFGKQQIENAKIEIFNIIGNLIFAEEVSQLSKYNVDLSSQPSGSYFLNVKSDAGNISKRIVINK